LSNRRDSKPLTSSAIGVRLGFIDDLEALSTLADRGRRQLYELVAAQAEPMTRDEAAAASGMSRSLVAYHLDRLAEAGLLETTYARPAGRGGPGAGRPAKRYRRAEREFLLQTPPRDYGLLAEILVRAEESGQPDDGAAERAAHAVGVELGRKARPAPVEQVLRSRGYEPFRDGKTLRFRNCPFHALATRHRGVVCSVNLALVEGLLAGAGERRLRASLEPGRAGCCVAVRPAPARPAAVHRRP
jgi:predicted ArsR family transcriptional regulator